MRLIVFILLLAILFPIPGIAQTKIELKDVKKINLNESLDGVAGFYFSRNYEIIRKKDKWFCYQTAQEYQPPHYNKKDKGRKAFKIQRCMIGEVSKQTLTAFLSTVSVIKPYYSWKMYKVDPELLEKGMDGYYKSSEEYPIKLGKRKVLLAYYHDPARIKAAIDDIQHTNAVDAAAGCSVAIIKNNKDTLKIETAYYRDYMQPWQIGGHDSYDLNINRFFVSVMSGNPISNKDLLTGKDFYDDIINEIQVQYHDKYPDKSTK